MIWLSVGCTTNEYILTYTTIWSSFWFCWDMAGGVMKCKVRVGEGWKHGYKDKDTWFGCVEWWHEVWLERLRRCSTICVNNNFKSQQTSHCKAEYIFDYIEPSCPTILVSRYLPRPFDPHLMLLQYTPLPCRWRTIFQHVFSCVCLQSKFHLTL